ncbi:MAG: RNase H family protein [Methyloligellaceae bacterium]
MGKLFDETKKQHNLFQAWRRIRENGYASKLEETRWATEQFDHQATRNIIRIQKRLRDGSFEFDPQYGVTKKKSSGSKRGIVMASVQNRIVERAVLDTLQDRSSFVKSVNTMPTSVGGVPERSVPHGLKMIDEAIKDGCRYFVRSDISGFFDGISRKSVIDKLASGIDDERFIELLSKATTVTLVNEKNLGDDRKVFPTDEQGVAQGSPLSPLFGNVLLYDFDVQFNQHGVICIRFIDDFVLLSKDERRVIKAFASAKTHLEKLGLKCHDPFAKSIKDKADFGEIKDGFVFLGYDIRPGLFQPSAKARAELLKSVRNRIKVGKRSIVDIIRQPHADNSQRYVQTMVGIDRILRGWGNAFAYNNAPETLEQLDMKIEGELGRFRSWYSDFIRNHDWKARRRTGGVCVLTDIKQKSFSDVPVRLKKGSRFVKSARTITISTDGAVQGHNKKQGRDKGPGGWAYVMHEDDSVGAGFALEVTNNQMELLAVIEALKAAPIDKSVCIRTDSQYVYKIANGENVAKSNGEMWREYQSLVQKQRSVKVVWIKGHNGDPYNERADLIAKEQALEASKQKSAA